MANKSEWVNAMSEDVVYRVKAAAMRGALEEGSLTCSGYSSNALGLDEVLKFSINNCEIDINFVLMDIAREAEARCDKYYIEHPNMLNLTYNSIRNVNPDEFIREAVGEQELDKLKKSLYGIRWDVGEGAAISDSNGDKKFMNHPSVIALSKDKSEVYANAWISKHKI